MTRTCLDHWSVIACVCVCVFTRLSHKCTLYSVQWSRLTLDTLPVLSLRMVLMTPKSSFRFEVLASAGVSVSSWYMCLSRPRIGGVTKIIMIIVQNFQKFSRVTRLVAPSFERGSRSSTGHSVMNVITWFISSLDRPQYKQYIISSDNHVWITIKNYIFIKGEGLPEHLDA